MASPPPPPPTPSLSHLLTLDDAARRTTRSLGLVPASAVEPLAKQARRLLRQLRRLELPLNRYLLLQAATAADADLFYFVLVNHLEELLPIVYTPAVSCLFSFFIFVGVRATKKSFLSFCLSRDCQKN